MARLRAGVAAWWRLGPIAGTLAAARALRRVVAAPLRRTWLRLRPVRPHKGAVRRALGDFSAAQALRDPVLAALPTVAAFERELDDLDASARASLLTRAESILAHRFDLLGSGPVDLGADIEWRRDFKSGRTWPLDHISQIVITYPDDSDIKVPWELSRFQHGPLLAAAFRVSGDRRYLDELGAQLDSWIAGNPVEFGPNWACTMDVAIRAANWVAALALCADAAAREPWLARAIESLYLHGRFIRSHLEDGEVRSNHFLSDIVGLLAVAALFARGEQGATWSDWASRRLLVEMEHQVRADGCDHEASTSYHRLVCELFICGTQAADALSPGVITDAHRERLNRMLDFTAAYTRPDGLAPQIGDADSGRFLPLADYGADFRDHRHLFRQAGRSYRPAAGHASFSDGGYYVMRAGDLYAIVRCGDVGVHGVGAHAHNDQLSFELAYGGQPLVIDPGSYLYTADPEARNLFRSTAFHSTLQLDGAEQNAFDSASLFLLEDCSRAEVVEWAPDGARAAFVGRHHGFEAIDPAAVHTRRIEFDGSTNTIEITDEIELRAASEFNWSLPLAGGRPLARGGAAAVEFDGLRLLVETDRGDLSVVDGWYSPSYGLRLPTPFLKVHARGEAGPNSFQMKLRVEPHTA